VPATRQRSTGAVVEPDIVSPAVYDCASVMVVLGSERLVRLEQLVAAAGRDMIRRHESSTIESIKSRGTDRMVDTSLRRAALAHIDSIDGMRTYQFGFMDITPPDSA
jgi:hypothetical protein